jgi:murein DD-endopeptidase MepM/ murein hydrolase activator NlpD
MDNQFFNSPLTPVGFDIPQQAQSVTPTPQQGLSQVDTTGLSLVGKSSEFTQQALQAKSRSDQIIQQSTQGVLEQQTASAQTIAQAASLEAQTAANRSAKVNQSFAQLTGNLTQFITDAAKKAEAERMSALKAKIEADKAAAAIALENNQVDWIEKGRIDKEGTVGYRSSVGEILAQYQLAPDDITSLTQKYYAPAIDYAKRTETNRIESARSVAEQQRNIRVEGLKAQLSTSLGGLAASAGLGEEVVSEHYANVQKAITDYMENDTLPILDRLTGAATAYKSVNEVMAKTNADSSQMQRDLDAFNQASEYASSLQDQVNSGQLSINDYNTLVKAKARAVGVPGFDVPDPSAPTRFLKGILQDADDIRELKQKEEMDAIAAVAADTSVIGSLATQFALDPAILASVESTDPKLQDKNVKAAVKMVNEFNDWRYKDVPSYNSKRANLTTDILGIKHSFNTWLVGATNRGGGGGALTPAESKQFEQLRIGGVIEAIQSGKQLTQEQAELVRSSAIELMAAKQQEAAALDQAYEINRQRFAQYGLHTDVATMKSAYQNWEKVRKEHVQRNAEIRAKALSNPYAQPGQSPNFNGGAPAKPGNWKPLAKRNYGGQVITMPFPQESLRNLGDLEPGQAFGDDRPGRTHAGLDFAVPIGTPTVSLVYGKVTEVAERGNYGKTVTVRGDDGFDYFYAHLDKYKVTVGSRVGPGQTVALTGNTGAGSGPHLHLEVTRNGEQVSGINPLTHLASKQFGDPAKGVRTANKGRVPTTVDARAIPLGGDNYLIDGKVGKLTEDQKLRFGVAAYSPSAPLRSSRQQGRRTGNGGGRGNLGYKRLDSDTQLQSALHGVAKNLGIPSEWLADVIAYESAGTFSPSIPNGLGYYGLIQFGDAAMQDLGVTRERLTSMSAAQQMQYVEKYLRLQMKYAGVSRLTSPEMVVAAINQGHTVLKDVWERGAAAVTDSQNRDGAGVTLKYYMENLGKYSGRKYTYMGDRRERLRTSVIHEQPAGGCTMCNQLSNQTAFIPHEGETYA